MTTVKNRIARRIRNKNGSYIVEAAVTLPLFLIAVLVMSSIILMYSCIESCCFTAASELRMGAAEAIFQDTGILVPHRLKRHITSDHSQIESARTIDYGYRISRWGQDELIALTMNIRMRTRNPAGLKASASFDQSFVASR